MSMKSYWGMGTTRTDIGLV